MLWGKRYRAQVRRHWHEPAQTSRDSTHPASLRVPRVPQEAVPTTMNSGSPDIWGSELTGPPLKGGRKGKMKWWKNHSF